MKTLKNNAQFQKHLSVVIVIFIFIDIYGRQSLRDCGEIKNPFIKLLYMIIIIITKTCGR